ncbi:MAG: hypothetical protein HYT87_13020 [Nitrospirae bacterium]|nr:hypothetical protein [Nitrospirota bacterium]
MLQGAEFEEVWKEYARLFWTDAIDPPVQSAVKEGLKAYCAGHNPAAYGGISHPEQGS